MRRGNNELPYFKSNRRRRRQQHFASFRPKPQASTKSPPTPSIMTTTLVYTRSNSSNRSGASEAQSATSTNSSVHRHIKVSSRLAPQIYLGHVYRSPPVATTDNTNVNDVSSKAVVVVKCAGQLQRDAATGRLHGPWKEWQAARQLRSVARSHPNVVQVFDTFVQRSNVFLVMEHCARGDLLAHLVATQPDSRLDKTQEAAKGLLHTYVVGCQAYTDADKSDRTALRQRFLTLQVTSPSEYCARLDDQRNGRSVPKMDTYPVVLVPGETLNEDDGQFQSWAEGARRLSSINALRANFLKQDVHLELRLRFMFAKYKARRECHLGRRPHAPRATYAAPATAHSSLRPPSEASSTHSSAGKRGSTGASAAIR